MERIMNRQLYDVLVAYFKEVRINKAGESFTVAPRMTTSGSVSNFKVNGGEEYAVCCPVCSDTRFRLSINHMWGCDADARFPASKLINCFNEQCDVSELLQSIIDPSFSQVMAGHTTEVKEVMTSDEIDIVKPLPFPDAKWCTPLDALPYNHKAATYIRNRNFDPIEIGEKWGVVYAHTYPVKKYEKDYGWLENRLFIPCEGGGWQARALDDRSKIKYATCPGYKKSKNVYNLDNKKGFTFRLIVEGVTDVWRIGDHSAAIFGKSISQRQVELIAENASVVGVMLDADAFDSQRNGAQPAGAKSLVALAQVIPLTFKIDTLPGKDAAEMTEAQIWKQVYKGAAAANIVIEREDVK